MRKQGALKLIHPSVCPSVHPSKCHKNFNLAHIFWSINALSFLLQKIWARLKFLAWYLAYMILVTRPLNQHNIVSMILTYFNVKFVAARGTTILRFAYHNIPSDNVIPTVSYILIQPYEKSDLVFCNQINVAVATLPMQTFLLTHLIVLTILLLAKNGNNFSDYVLRPANTNKQQLNPI